MATSNKRYHNKKALTITIFKWVVMIGGLLLITKSIRAGLRLRSYQQQRVERLRQEVLALQETNQQLKEQAKYYQSLEFVEKEAREKLKMTRPGETIMIVPEENTEENQHQEVGSEDKGFFSKIISKIKKLWSNFTNPSAARGKQ